MNQEFYKDILYKMFSMLGEESIWSSFNYFFAKRYALGTWVPDQDSEKSFIYTMLIAIEEITEVEVAMHFGKSYEMIEELSDYYGLVHVISIVQSKTKEPQTPILFPVSHLEVIKKITKAIRYGLTDEAFVLMQHYYLSFFGRSYYEYKFLQPYNIVYYLVAINMTKSIIRFVKTYDLYDIVPLKAFLTAFKDRYLLKLKVSGKAKKEIEGIINTTIERYLFRGASS